MDDLGSGTLVDDLVGALGGSVCEEATSVSALEGCRLPRKVDARESIEGFLEGLVMWACIGAVSAFPVVAAGRAEAGGFLPLPNKFKNDIS